MYCISVLSSRWRQKPATTSCKESSLVFLRRCRGFSFFEMETHCPCQNEKHSTVQAWGQKHRRRFDFNVAWKITQWKTINVVIKEKTLKKTQNKTKPKKPNNCPINIHFLLIMEQERHTYKRETHITNHILFHFISLFDLI